MIISELCVYPLKSAQGIKLKQSQVLTKGLLWDRELMLVAGSGKFITQRQFPQLAKVQVQIEGQQITLKLIDESFPPHSFQLAAQGSTTAIEIWHDRLMAIDQGDEVAHWFHQLLQLPSEKVCRLVKQSSSQPRLLAKKYPNDEEQPLSFADNFPVMLTATASLAELNERIIEIHQKQSQAISMERFRPNVVVDTTEPFIEDRWSMIKIGEVEFNLARPCSRCIITTIDQQQGLKNQLKEPLNTLGTFRQLSERGVMFGVNMIPQNEGIIRTGDQVQVLEIKE